MFALLNAGMIWGTALISLPIIIYLLQRLKVQELDWAAMQFLLDIVEEQKRRIIWEELLLLLLRCLMFLFLALAIARPILTSSGAGGLFTQSGDAVILIDASYSMQTREGAGSRWERAKEKALALIDAMPPEFGISIILASELPEPIITSFETNHDLVRETIRKLMPASLAGEAGTSIAEAARVLRAGKNPAKYLFVISDFQRRDWEGADVTLPKILKDLSANCEITFIPAGDANTDNLAASLLTLSSGGVRTGARARFAGAIFNHGKAMARDVSVDLQIDGEVVDSTTLSVPPGQAAQLLFSPIIHDAGPHQAVLKIRSDSLDADNARYLGFKASGPAKVLAILDDVPPEGDPKATDFIELCLSPYQDGAEDPNALYSFRHLATTDFSAEPVGDYELIIAANLTGLTGTEAAVLEDFVRRGGGVLAFMGANTNAELFNASLHKDGKGLLPWRLLPEALQDGDEGKEKPLTINIQHPEHPLWGVLGYPNSVYMKPVRVYKSFGFEVGDAARVIPLLSARVGDAEKSVPIITDVKFGRGHVIWVGTSADLSFSNFAVRPAFVAFINQAVRYLRSFRGRDSVLTAGASEVRYVDFRHSQATYNLTSPTNDSQGVSVLEEDGEFKLSLPPMREAGFYVLSNQDDVNDREFIAVNGRLDEGKIECVTPDELTEKFGEIGEKGIRIHLESTMGDIFAGSGGASEIAAILLFLMLLCWLGENLLAHKMSKP